MDTSSQKVGDLGQRNKVADMSCTWVYLAVSLTDNQKICVRRPVGAVPGIILRLALVRSRLVKGSAMKRTPVTLWFPSFRQDCLDDISTQDFLQPPCDNIVLFFWSRHGRCEGDRSKILSVCCDLAD